MAAELTAAERDEIINQVFQNGSAVEVSPNHPQFCKSWYTATVLRLYTTKMQVLFHCLSDSESKKRIIRFVDLERARPLPPLDQPEERFLRGMKVDVDEDGGWWEGYIVTVHGSSDIFSVILESTGKVRQFLGFELRIHRTWEYNRWVLPALHPVYSRSINNIQE